MKKALFSLCILALLFIGACSSDSNDPVVPVCSSAVTGLTVSQSSDMININMTATSGALYYEISLQEAGGDNINPENGSIRDLETTIGTTAVYSPGNYILYARTVCPDGTKGTWFGPRLLNVQPFCATPQITNVSTYSVDWNFIPGVSTFQLQYGPSGFPLGSGTIVNVSNNTYSGMSMAANQAYDFYVRPYCPASSGYGNWSTKYMYVSPTNVNMCTAPTNIVAQYTSSTQVKFNFNPNGETVWEYALTNSGNLPIQSEIGTVTIGYVPAYTISPGYHGIFYMRAVCANGNRTGWVTLDI